MTASSVSPLESFDGASKRLDAAFEAEGSSIFGAIAHDVGLADAALTLKGLQLLYWLRSQHPLTRPDMIRSLAQWRGSGRNEIAQFEPVDSAPALLDGMIKEELLWEMGVPTKRVLVSPKGIALLLRLHPACEDLDLPWRLARWEAEWPASKGEVDRYVRSFISRQRSFVAP